MRWFKKKKVKLEAPKIDIKDLLEATGEPHKLLPRTGYTAFGPVDVKIRFEYEDGTEESIAEIQQISWEAIMGDGGKGSICCLIFDDDAISTRLSKVKNIRLKAANEYGDQLIARLLDVKFTKNRFATSIDDIVMESWWEFTIGDLEPWRKPSVT